MVLGFISLSLTFSQNYIAKICIPLRYANTMLPCLPKYGHSANAGSSTEGSSTEDSSTEGEHHRRLLWYERRFLSGGGEAVACKEVSVSCLEVHVRY